MPSTTAAARQEMSAIASMAAAPAATLALGASARGAARGALRQESAAQNPMQPSPTR
jgi:hypothetical protein